MAVKIVTDSLSDITSDVAEQLGITVVPLTVLFGHETFLDRVNITTDEFYYRLENDSVWPTTTQPTPAAFTEVYENLSKETDEILVITLSSKLSGTYQSAIGGKEMVKGKSQIEVIDSKLVAMGLGLVVLSIAQKAKDGASLDELVEATNQAKEHSQSIFYFDTLKYLAKGGRIGKAQSLLGSMLSVKPILTIKEGEITPVTRVRSLAAGMDYLFNFVTGYSNLESLAVEHTTTKEVADALENRLSAKLSKEKIHRSTVSPVLGVHGGPGAVAVSVLEA